MSSAPLTPADCDLQDYPSMMVNIARLRGSDFDAIGDDAAWRAGVNLWLSSWHQVPAASLENKDATLVKAAGLGRDMRTWARIKDEAMHGWLLCADGKWYHPVVAETALEAWLTKLGQRLSSGAGNAKRYKLPFDAGPLYADIRTAAEMLARLNPKSEALKKKTVQAVLAGVPLELPSGDADVPSGGRRVPSGSQGKERKGNPIPPAPQGAPVLVEWTGPKSLLDALSRIKAEGQVWALSVLRVCRFEEGPPPTLVVTRGWAFDALRRDADAELRHLGLTMRLEQAA